MPPVRIEFKLYEANMEEYLGNISDYAQLTSLVIILSFLTMIRVIKKVSENHALA